MKIVFHLIAACLLLLVLPGCESVQQAVKDLDLDIPVPGGTAGNSGGVTQHPSIPGTTDSTANKPPAAAQPLRKAIAWNDIDRDRLEPQYVSLFRLIVADNLDVARQHPDAFAAQHHIFFELPIYIQRSGGKPSPRDIPEWEQIANQLGNEFGRREVAASVVDGFVKSLDEYDPKSVEREFVITCRAKIKEYDFASKSFPIQINELNFDRDNNVLRVAEGRMESPFRTNHATGIKLADGSDASLHFAAHGSLSSAVSVYTAGTDAKPAQFWMNRRLTLQVALGKQVKTLVMSEAEAKALREAMGPNRDIVTWQLRVRVNKVNLDRQIAEGRLDKATKQMIEWVKYEVLPMETEVLGGRLTYLDSSTREQATIATFGNAPPE